MQYENQTHKKILHYVKYFHYNKLAIILKFVAPFPPWPTIDMATHVSETFQIERVA